MYNKRRRYITLLETLIALGLAMLILTTLTFFYRHFAQVTNQLEQLQEESFKMRYIENRLAAILPQAISEVDQKGDFFFFTLATTQALSKSGSPTLYFTYDNGVKLEKLFSNNVLGRLYLDQEGALCLATWPSPQRWSEGVEPPVKREILLEGVKELEFGFFVAPEKSWQLEKSDSKSSQSQQKKEPPIQTVIVKPTPEGSWLPSWSSDYQQLPAIVRIQVTLANGAVKMFVFPLPKGQRQIVYRQ